jgi:hypothetical protein
MKRFFKNIKNLLIFSDSELLELVTALVFIVVNPLRPQIHSVDPVWYIVGVISGLLIIFGLGRKCIRTRELGLLLALVNLTAANLIEVTHYHYEPGYLVQNLVVGFVWWKVSKQRLILDIRKGCNHGRK